MHYGQVILGVILLGTGVISVAQERGWKLIKSDPPAAAVAGPVTQSANAPTPIVVAEPVIVSSPANNEGDPELVCDVTIGNSQLTKLSCDLTEYRPGDADIVHLTFTIDNDRYTFYGRYAPDVGIRINSGKFNNGAVEQMSGYCEVGDGEAFCEINIDGSIIGLSAYYDGEFY